jgi:PAS domain S-box-containing protein
MKDHGRLTRVELIKLVTRLQRKASVNELQHIKNTRERRKVQADLHESNERLRAILETAVEGIITIDDRGLIESFNTSAEKIFGYQAREIIGQNVKQLMPAPYRQEHDGYIHHYRHGGRAKIIGIGREVVGQRKNGQVFPMDLSVSEVRLADRRIFTGFVRDISARKEAEKALLHYAALVESSDDAIIGKTLDGYITSWNRGAEIVFGYKREKMIGQHLSVLIPENRRDEEPAILERIRRGESVDHYETVRRRKDGKLIDISVTVSPIRDADGNIIGASKVARDITERKNLEQEILKISDREQQRIGQDLHDGLCQELTGIELLCQVLEQKLTAKSKLAAKQVGEIGAHVREAISHTRKLARGLSPVELEANGFMSALRELAAHVHKLFRLECRFECPEPVLIRNNVFATHLYRIVQEAINNAIKHGKARHILISLQPARGQFALSVSDDGIGFTKKNKNGDGMGLRIMKYRASVVGATLEVCSGIDDAGTKVICTFRKNI